MIACQTTALNSLLKYRIIRELYFSQASSCNELSEALGKSLPLISKSLNKLIESGYVLEKGYAPSNGGRPPLMYSLKPGNLYVLAISVDQLYTKIAMLDMLHQYVSPVETVELKLLNNKTALQTMARRINDHIDRTGIDRKKIMGAGMGMPGFVNTRLGINYSYLHTGTNESMRDYLQQALGMPVQIENDSSTIALAELRFGLAKGLENVMVIDIGWGIGLGMIVNGILFRGHNGYAGELSHIPISESNTLCDCGKRGCLETEASLRVVAKKAIEEIKKGKVSSLQATENPEQMSAFIMKAANHGDQYAIELLTDIGNKIGKAIAILIHIVNPELIILSGRGAEVGKILIAPIQQSLNRYCIPRLAEDTEVKVSQLGHEAGIISAAALAVQHFGDVVF